MGEMWVMKKGDMHMKSGKKWWIVRPFEKTQRRGGAL